MKWFIDNISYRIRDNYKNIDGIYQQICFDILSINNI